MEEGSSNNIRILRQKLSEDGEDRISNLPECIQSQILSHLPTEDAVRTSILSKTWLNLWTCIDNICFDDRIFYYYHEAKDQKKSFIDFISRVLSHLSNQSIQNSSFTFKLLNKYDSCLVNGWIFSILHQRVKNLRFRYSNDLIDVCFSNSLFNSISLVELELKIHGTIRVPSFVDLPNLRYLRLKKIKFRSDSSLNDVLFSNFLFNSISLVELVLSINYTIRVPSFVNLPNLKYLRLKNIKFTSDSSLNDFISNFFSNSISLVELELEIDCTIRVPSPSSVDVPNLKYLRLKRIKFISDSSNKVNDVLFSNSIFSSISLVELELIYCTIGLPSFVDLPNLKYLILKEIKFTNDPSNELNDVVFSNSLFNSIFLVRLELEIDCTIRIPSYVDLPNLKSLSLKNIKFTSDSSSLSSEIILNFPNLKQFQSYDCLWTTMQIVNLQVPSLVGLIIHFYNKYSELVEPNDCVTIKFCGSHLQYFYYHGKILQDYVLSDPSSALNASAHFFPHSTPNVRICKLLKQFSQVKYLRLHYPFHFERIHFSVEDPPTFTMLQRLDLNCLTSDVLMKILLKSPNLTKVRASQITMQQVSEVEEGLKQSTSIPKCMMTTLKKIKA